MILLCRHFNSTTHSPSIQFIGEKERRLLYLQRGLDCKEKNKERSNSRWSHTWDGAAWESPGLETSIRTRNSTSSLKNNINNETDHRQSDISSCSVRIFLAFPSSKNSSLFYSLLLSFDCNTTTLYYCYANSQVRIKDIPVCLPKITQTCVNALSLPFPSVSWVVSSCVYMSQVLISAIIMCVVYSNNKPTLT